MPAIMAGMIGQFRILQWLSPRHFEVDSFRATYLYIMVLLLACARRGPWPASAYGMTRTDWRPGARAGNPAAPRRVCSDIEANGRLKRGASMRLERILGGLIFCDLVLGIATIVTETASVPFLPEPLRAYVAASGSGDLVLFALWVAVVVSTVLAWIGLLNLLRLARTVYLASWCAYVLYVILTGPTVMTPFGSVLDTAMALVGGAILGLVYFSELRLRFRALSDLWR